MKQLATAALLGLAFSGAATANTYTLGFDQGATCTQGCSNYSFVAQTYGDVTGVVDLSYINVLNNTTPASLRWWDTSYNDLRGVVWSGVGDGTGQSHSRIEFKPLDGQSVTLNGFDIGAYPSTTRGTHIRVYEIGGTSALFSYDGSVGIGSSTHNTFSPNVSSSKGLWLDWYDSAYNVGVDNVSFSIAAVPEPETYALLLAGLGLLGGIARKKKAS